MPPNKRPFATEELSMAAVLLQRVAPLSTMAM
jgi:hypothetical protein